MNLKLYILNFLHYRLRDGLHSMVNYMRKAASMFTCLLIIFITAPFLFSAENPKQLNKNAIELGKKKMYPEAIIEFDKAVDIYDISTAKVLHNRAYASEEKGDIKAAINNYEEALRRNPMQIVTGERLGYIYYKTTDYENAVRVGEYVIKIDQKNKEVPKWLPDAYMKKLQREKQVAEEKKKKDNEELFKKILEEKKKKEQDTIITGWLDVMFRTGYYTNTGVYNLILNKGLILDTPQSFNFKITPSKSWEINIMQENPFLGGTMPTVCISTETVDFLFKFTNFSLGAGIMLNHYIGNTAFDTILQLTDFKVGIVFGYRTETHSFVFNIYPRLIPSVLFLKTGYTYDTDWYLLKYQYVINPIFKIYSILSIREYFLYDHVAILSSYWGVYEISLGATISILDKSQKPVVDFSIEFTERLYMRNLLNAEPYSFIGNGQGWFGMNFSKWMTGAPFSGFWGNSHSLSLRVDEYLGKYVFLYEKFLFELSSQVSDHSEFNFQFGVGFKY